VASACVLLPHTFVVADDQGVEPVTCNDNLSEVWEEIQSLDPGNGTSVLRKYYICEGVYDIGFPVASGWQGNFPILLRPNIQYICQDDEYRGSGCVFNGDFGYAHILGAYWLRNRVEYLENVLVKGFTFNAGLVYGVEIRNPGRIRIENCIFQNMQTWSQLSFVWTPEFFFAQDITTVESTRKSFDPYKEEEDLFREKLIMALGGDDTRKLNQFVIDATPTQTLEVDMVSCQFLVGLLLPCFWIKFTQIFRLLSGCVIANLFFSPLFCFVKNNKEYLFTSNDQPQQTYLAGMMVVQGTGISGQVWGNTTSSLTIRDSLFEDNVFTTYPGSPRNRLSYVIAVDNDSAHLTLENNCFYNTTAPGGLGPILSSGPVSHTNNSGVPIDDTECQFISIVDAVTGMDGDAVIQSPENTLAEEFRCEEYDADFCSVPRTPSPSLSLAPSSSPTLSMMPTLSTMPSGGPSAAPSPEPTTLPPTSSPSFAPSSQPTVSAAPSPERITLSPSSSPSFTPSSSPSYTPSSQPTASAAPSPEPSSAPTSGANNRAIYSFLSSVVLIGITAALWM